VSIVICYILGVMLLLRLLPATVVTRHPYPTAGGGRGRQRELIAECRRCEEGVKGQGDRDGKATDRQADRGKGTGAGGDKKTV
jgi:hypothetical protein